MDLNRKIIIGKFRHRKTNKIFYYPIIKKYRDKTYMVIIWCGSKTYDISMDNFIIGEDEYELLEETKFGTKS